MPINRRFEVQTKWNSDNIMFQEIAVKNYLPGTRFGLTKSFSPSQGKFNSALTFLLSQGRLRIDASVFRQNDKTQYTTQVVLGLHNNWIVGAHAHGEPSADKLNSLSATIAYQEENVQIVTILRNDKSELFLYQKVGESTEFVVSKSFDGKKTTGELTLAHEICKDTRLLAKCDSQSSLWFGAHRKLNSSIGAKVYGEWNQKNRSFNRIGMGFEVEC